MISYVPSTTPGVKQPIESGKTSRFSKILLYPKNQNTQIGTEEISSRNENLLGWILCSKNPLFELIALF
jgi:hypothetical protein